MEVDECLNQPQEEAASSVVDHVESESASAVVFNENAVAEEASHIITEHMEQPVEQPTESAEQLAAENLTEHHQTEQIPDQSAAQNNTASVADSLDENLSNQIANLNANEEELPEAANSSQLENVAGEISSAAVDDDTLNGTANESMNLDDATCKSALHSTTAASVKKDAHDDDSGELDEAGGADDLEDMDQNDSLLFKELGLMAGGGGGGSSMSASAQAAVDSGNNVYTFRKTEWDVKKMENYVKLTFGEVIAMEKLDPPTLNEYLKSFFEHAKKSDGMDYEPESLIGFMNSYERYLKTKNYPESLLRSDAFKESRTILKNKRELVRSIGKLIRTKSKDTCFVLQYHRNLLKEKGLLNRDNPDGLLAEVSFS
jgi:hypothetical protein